MLFNCHFAIVILAPSGMSKYGTVGSTGRHVVSTFIHPVFCSLIQKMRSHSSSFAIFEQNKS